MKSIRSYEDIIHIDMDTSFSYCLVHMSDNFLPITRVGSLNFY